MITIWEIHRRRKSFCFVLFNTICVDSKFLSCHQAILFPICVKFVWSIWFASGMLSFLFEQWTQESLPHMNITEKKCLKQSHSLDQNQQFQNSSNLIRPSCRKLRGLQIVGNWTVNKQENGNGTFTFCFKYLFVGCHWSFPLIPYYMLFIQRKCFTFRCKWNRMI